MDSLDPMKRVLGWPLLLLVLFHCGARAEIDVFGYSEPSRSAEVAFSESGVLEELVVQEGDVVKKGDKLAHLDTRVLTHDLAIAQEQLRLQELRFKQLEGLWKDKTLSRDEYERGRADLLTSREQVKRIMAQIDKRTVYAKFDGVVLKIHREVSESISANNTALLTLVKLDPLHVTFYVPVDAVDAFSKGATVRLTLGGKHSVLGTVAFVSPVIDAASRTVRVRLVIDNSDGKLRSGMLCVPFME